MRESKESGIHYFVPCTKRRNRIHSTQHIVGYINKKMKTKTKKQKISGVEIGRLGGKSTVKTHGKAYMKALGKKGAEARWGKKLKANKK